MAHSLKGSSGDVEAVLSDAREGRWRAWREEAGLGITVVLQAQP